MNSSVPMRNLSVQRTLLLFGSEDESPFHLRAPAEHREYRVRKWPNSVNLSPDITSEVPVR
jgi:hypothetical protein